MNIADFVKKHMRSGSRSLFIKIFLVCTLLSLFIITILGIYTYYYIFVNLDAEIEKYEQKKVTETLNTCSMLFGEMQKLTINYALNYKFTQFAYISRDILADRYQDIKSNQDIISNTINSSNYIDNLFIYYKRNNYILDYSGAANFSFYYDTGWYTSYESMAENSAILETRKVNKRSDFSGQHTNIITFITGMPYANGPKDGAIVLNVNEKIVSDLLKNITAGNSNSYAFLVDKSGKILSSSKETYLFQDISQVINIPSGLLELNEGSFKLSFNGTGMISYFETSSINNWKLFYIESENDIFKKSASIRNLTLFVFFILLLFTAAASLVFSSRVYNPIKKIIANIKAITTVDNENISDISFINGGLDLLRENNKNLEQQLKQNEILIRETFLSQLIGGKLFNKSEIKSKADYLSIDLEADYFKVAVIQGNSLLSYPFDIQKYEFYKIAAINMVTGVFDTLNVEALCTQDPNDNILILIKLRSVKDVNETEAIVEQVLEDIRDNIEKQLSLSVSIGMGRMYNDLSNVGVSCKEALEALRYKFLKGDPSVISFTDISRGEKEKLYYPIKSEQKLISLIKLCNYEKTVSCLNEMLDDIIRQNKNFEHIEVCLSNMVGIIPRYIYELNLNSREVLGEDTIVNVSVESFKNIQHFTEWISTRFREIIEYQIGRQKDTSKSFAYEVKEYIEKVYTEEISLDTVANHFNYNSSYFCKIFKENLGVSFWEYVAKIRIEKSKKLLTETADTIEQIAGAVGYNNRFSYIRTFKKYVSITPGEYRVRFR